MDKRLENWMNSLNMSFDGSYQDRHFELRKFYESQKVVVAEISHPLCESPTVHLHSELLLDTTAKL